MCECWQELDASGTHLARCPFQSQQITTHNAIQDVMYALVWGIRHIIWKERWYALTSRVSLRTNLYITWKDQVFIANVVVIDPMRNTMSSNVINQLAGATMKFNTIIEIRKYRRLHEGHHFIPMTMEVHNTPRCDMDHFIRECAHLFHNRRSGGHLSLSFCIQFFKQHVSIALQRALASAI
jgi:hypothetical protein